MKFRHVITALAVMLTAFVCSSLLICSTPAAETAGKTVTIDDGIGSFVILEDVFAIDSMKIEDASNAAMLEDMRNQGFSFDRMKQYPSYSVYAPNAKLDYVFSFATVNVFANGDGLITQPSGKFVFILRAGTYYVVNVHPPDDKSKALWFTVLVRDKPETSAPAQTVLPTAPVTPTPSVTPASAPAAPSVVAITLDDKAVDSDSPPYIDENGRTMVPLRFIAEALGAEIQWITEDKTAIFFLGVDTVSVKIGDKKLVRNGVPIVMDTLAVLKNSRTYVPVRFIAEAFGVNVGWNAVTNTVELTSPAATNAAGSTNQAVTTPTPASTTPTRTPAPTASPTPKPTPGKITGDITTLLDNGTITAKVAGSSIQLVTLMITNKSNQAVNVIIPLGTYFLADSSSDQNMVSLQRYSRDIAPGDSANVNISSACMEIHDDIPDSRSSFSVRSLSDSGTDAKLKRVLEALESNGCSYPVCQAAVWLVYGASESEVQNILVRSDGTNVISTADIAKAREMINLAG